MGATQGSTCCSESEGGNPQLEADGKVEASLAFDGSVLTSTGEDPDGQARFESPEALKRVAEDDATRITEDDATRKAEVSEEQDAKLEADEQASRLAEMKRAKEEEEACRKAAEEEEAARKKDEEEEAARKKDEEEEAARKKAEAKREAKKKAEAERQKKKEEEAQRKKKEKEITALLCEDGKHLCKAAQKGNVSRIKDLLEFKANVDAAYGDPHSTQHPLSDPSKRTPLQTASEHGTIDVVKVLLEHKADINKVVPVKLDTSLHIAARYGHLEIVKALVDAGADIQGKNERKQTAALVAEGKGKTDVVQWLHNYKKPSSDSWTLSPSQR